MKKYLSVILSIALLACNAHKEEEAFSLKSGLRNIVHIDGVKQNGDYLYVTAGDKLYSIGNQYGEFPDVGFHVQGEMGGVWQHPIKLLDTYTLTIKEEANNASRTLSKCHQFTAFPFANQFRYDENELNMVITRTDFVTDSLPVLVVEYQIHNKASGDRKLNLSFDVNTDLSPVWLGERCNMIDSRDKLIDDIKDNTVLVKDSLNNWYVGITSETGGVTVSDVQPSPQKGQGVSLKINVPQLLFAPQEKKTIRFYISGSIKDPQEITRNLASAKNGIEKLFDKKKRRYDEIDKTAAITIPDTLMMQAYRWGKYNTDWLVREIPGMGRGINAGLPDYPWYFSNDQGATISGILGTRDPQLFYDSWAMLLRISNEASNNSGGVIHEVSTNGIVYAKDRMEESQEFIITAWNIFRWTGNKEFLKTYYDQGKKVWEFLKPHTNSNLYVKGAGGTEIGGLNDEMLDVAVWTQVFFKTMAQMAIVFDELAVSEDFAAKAETLKQNINNDWWIPSENRYADFRADKKKALQLIDTALKDRIKDGRNLWAKKKLTELKQQILSGEYKGNGYVVFYNPTLGPLLEDIADETRGKCVLKGMEFFTNKFGMYIVGIARPDDITLDEGSVAHRLNGDFNYNEAIMPAATSGLAIAELKYNGADAAMKYINQYLNNFSFATPGSTYEVSPDYGMFVQAWNVCAINIPLIHYMFGVNPDAYNKTILFKPDMPSAWNFAKLENLLIGDNKLTIDFKRDGNVQIYKIISTQDNWNFNFAMPHNGKSIKVNGKDAVKNDDVIRFSGKENTIEVLN